MLNVVFTMLWPMSVACVHCARTAAPTVPEDLRGLPTPAHVLEGSPPDEETAVRGHCGHAQQQYRDAVRVASRRHVWCASPQPQAPTALQLFAALTRKPLSFFSFHVGDCNTVWVARSFLPGLCRGPTRSHTPLCSPVHPCRSSTSTALLLVAYVLQQRLRPFLVSSTLSEGLALTAGEMASRLQQAKDKVHPVQGRQRPQVGPQPGLDAQARGSSESGYVRNCCAHPPMPQRGWLSVLCWVTWVDVRCNRAGERDS